MKQVQNEISIFDLIVENNKKYRIRKLTPRECARLMGVIDEDSDQIFSRQPDTLKYHLCGDSIVTACLMAIFGKMLDVDYEAKIDAVVREISTGKGNEK